MLTNLFTGRTASLETASLEKALAAVKRCHADIAAAQSRQTALEKEVGELLAVVDPTDDAAVQKLATRQAQATLTPQLIARISSTIESQHGPALLAEIESMKRQMEVVREEDYKAFQEEVRPLFAMLWPSTTAPNGEVFNPATAKLASCSLCPRGFLADNNGTIGVIPVPSQPRNGREQWDRDVMDAAEELLKLAAGWKPYAPGSATDAIKKII